jgi:MFS family permease
VTAGVLGLVWGMVRGSDAGWASPEVVATLAAGAVLTGVFVAWELRAPEPMLSMRFFRSRAFSAANTSGFLLYAALYGCAFFLTQFLQITLRYGPFGAGLRLAPWTATVFIVSWIAGGLVNRFGERPLITVGLTLQAAGFAWIALIASPRLDYLLMIPPLVMAGCGVSLAMPAAQHAVIAAVPPPSVGAASGVFNTFRQLGGTFGVAIFAAVLADSGSYASPQSFSDGFAPAMGGAVGLSVAAVIAGLLIPGHRPPAPAEPAPRQAGALAATELTDQ